MSGLEILQSNYDDFENDQKKDQNLTNYKNIENNLRFSKKELHYLEEAAIKLMIESNLDKEELDKLIHNPIALKSFINRWYREADKLRKTDNPEDTRGPMGTLFTKN